ncbi:MAG TPA: HAMP domain-containing sensor histidine kinase [Kofleriaceae bacterium]|nr:HAMP domain-containing sensor histidine kinase [Kofleriaceae bacterium]
MAHDLNNYLTVVRVAFDLLEQRDGDELLWARARDAIESAIGLNRNLIEYVRGSQPEPRAIDLSALVQRVLGILNRFIPPPIVVVVDEAGNLPLVRGIGPELEQMVLNLVINACDAMPRGGELRIRLRSPGPSAVVIDVMDTGSGGLRNVDSDTITPSGKPGRNGRSLGLGIVRSVVERHRAVMKVGPRDGGGTIATVVLEPWRA